PDPLAAALAHPATDHRAIPGVLARIAGERIGGAGWPDPGGAVLRAEPRSAVLVLGQGPAQLAAAQADGRAVIRARDPFAPTRTADDALPLLDAWTLLDAAAEIRGASSELALLALAGGVAVADGPLAGADPLATWAALLAATRCADPFRRAPCGLDAALDLLALWAARARDGRRVVACLGML
ncbi:hypothetical protein, partial [Falsiroseomonas oryziterrae]|uniref:hypothetical protein n=1 Tax=Falsiroseomonas oryziterrae TaxID=2911368 RepID=UPI0035575AAA